MTHIKFAHIVPVPPSPNNTNPKGIRSLAWALERGLEPGYGGIWPGDPDAPTCEVTIRSKGSGQEYTVKVPKDRYIYFVFEEMGIDLPIVNQARMCRQGEGLCLLIVRLVLC
jgi:hypothetical protein